jgi:hypothetical protein
VEGRSAVPAPSRQRVTRQLRLYSFHSRKLGTDTVQLAIRYSVFAIYFTALYCRPGRS